MPLALLVLALSAFAIGTTEFVIMGLLPDVAHSLSVSIPDAGWLISVYALGVAIGAPIMAVLTASLPRKRALLLLMAIFVVGNMLCAIAFDYGFLMVARVVTALCHGAFFGIGSVVAASLVPENRKASAVALMFTGLTLANVLGVPLGTALGQLAGWRVPFWLSIIMVAIGLYIRLGILETPVFRRIVAEERIERVPAVEVMKRQPKQVFLAQRRIEAPFGRGLLAVLRPRHHVGDRARRAITVQHFQRQFSRGKLLLDGFQPPSHVALHHAFASPIA